MPAEVRFYQPPSGDIVAWEFQASIDHNNWDWVDVSSPVKPCVDCYETVIIDSRPYSYVRARSMDSNGDYSVWSNVITLPEPSFILLTSISILLISVFSKKAKKTYG